MTPGSERRCRPAPNAAAARQARQPPARTTRPRASRSSRAWRPSGAARACTSARPTRAASTTSSGRSSTTRSTRRWPATRRRSTVTIQPDGMVEVVRRRPRHPGRQALDRQGRARGRQDRPPRRRQVRRRRLQGVGRPPRRGRQRRQRALGVDAGRDRRATAASGRQEYARGKPTGAGQEDRPAGRPHGHDDAASRPTPRCSRRIDYSLRHDRPALPRVGVPHQGRLDHASSTSASIASGRSTSRAASSRSSATSTGTRRSLHQRPIYVEKREGATLGRGRPPVQRHATPRTSSRSPTTSTRSTAAPTSPASARR